MKFVERCGLICCLLVMLSGVSSKVFGQMADSCGSPTFDRATDRGFFVWQDCSSGNWFLRATNGGSLNEFAVEGRLRLSEDIQSPAAFNLDNIGVQDIFDFSNLQNVLFRFRVFSMAQDGADFQLTPGTKACLFVNTSDDSPIIFGRNNLELQSPLNLSTLSSSNCIAFQPVVNILLDEE